MEIGEASARISDHVAVDVDSSTSNQAQQELSIQEGTTKQDRFSSGKSEVKDEIASMQSYSVEIANVQTNHNSGFQSESLSRVPNDGYNWRKYGQKQAKGNENSISYYKCTYINCQTKRKIVRSLDGKIIEIVYRGTHNHPEPQATMRNSSSASNPVTAEIPDHAFASHGNGQMDSVAISESSSITMGDDDFVQSSQKNRSGLDGKVEGENEGISAPGSRTVREPRVVVKTTSDVDYLDDGYIWRKYAQKVVKANPIPRSYYKCRHPGCPVRKQVEIASHDPRAVVITTYEGKHNHDAPAAQGSESHSVNRPLPNKHSAITHNTNNSINTSLQSFRAAEGQSTFTLEDSSLSTGEEDFRRSFEKSNKSGGDE
ncbi:WRKY transcription factor WRKY24-like [Senna tora]|uniref:WRKY transcription factor WRKY24-like n=1 Tax=Senna tora TaxID=362788 RepID=A0A834T6X7_9FABA|nr:WRKY transcription factor WRKY24-like [Senna tora]